MISYLVQHCFFTIIIRYLIKFYMSFGVRWNYPKLMITETMYFVLLQCNQTRLSYLTFSNPHIPITLMKIHYNAIRVSTKIMFALVIIIRVLTSNILFEITTTKMNLVVEKFSEMSLFFQRNCCSLFFQIIKKKIWKMAYKNNLTI